MVCENCKDILIIADFIEVFMGKLFSDTLCNNSVDWVILVNINSIAQ